MNPITHHSSLITTPAFAEWICLDIETTAGRPESADEWMRRQWSPSPNWTPDTIGKRYKEAYEKKLAKLALLDAAGIAVIALQTPQQRVLLHWIGESDHLATERDETFVRFHDEKTMLIYFREYLREWAGDQTLWIGHNIRAFDLPRLRLAFLRNGLQIPPALASHQPHYDTMREFCRNFSVERSEMVGLSEVLDKLGMVNHKGVVEGSQIDELIAQGEVETILRYAALDVQAEAKLALRLMGKSQELA